jgi:hypothetical protein
LRYGEIDAAANRSSIRESTRSFDHLAEKSFAEASSWMMVQSMMIFCAAVRPALSVAT